MAQPETYSRTQIILHWAVFALVAFQIVFHESITEIWDARMEGSIPNVAQPHLHVAIGMLIFVLVLWRLWLRFTRGAPSAPADENPALKTIAAITHILFYVLLVGLPISGAAAWFGGLPQPAEAHGIAEKVLLALIALHVLAALAHHFWFRTNVLRRMLGMN